MFKYSWVVVVAVLALCSSVQSLKGVLELDEITWDAIMDGSRPVVVAFQEFNWKHPKDYEKVAEEFKKDKVLVAKVDRSGNADLKAKFNIDTYPTVKFFPKGETQNPTQYAGADSSSDLIDFIRLLMNPKLQQLKQLAESFVVAKPAERTSILKKAETLVDDLQGSDKEYATFYTSSMKKIQEKGDEFVESEKTRLNGLISSKATADKKKAEFTKRLNILNTFVKKDVVN